MFIRLSNRKFQAERVCRKSSSLRNKSANHSKRNKRGVTMLAVYSLSTKKKKVLNDPKKYKYNLQTLSRDNTKSYWNCVEKRKASKCPAVAVVSEIENTIISLSDNHCHAVNLAKIEATSIENRHIAKLQEKKNKRNKNG